QLVGLGGIDERLRLRIERQLAAEAVLEAVELQAVVLGEILLHALERLVGFLAVAEGLGLAVERHLLAQAVRDVGQVAQRAGVVALEDVGMEVGDLAAAHGGDEVAEVAAFLTSPAPARVLHQGLALLLLLALGIELGRTAVATGDRSLFEMD